MTAAAGAHYEKDGVRYKRISSVAKLAADWYYPDGIARLDQWKKRLREETPDPVEAHLQGSSRGGDILHFLLERESEKGHGILVDIQQKVGDIVSTEQTVYDDALGIAGTYDAATKDSVIDWKSSRAVHLSQKIQVSFYAKAKGKENAYIVYNFGGNKQGFSVCKVDVEKHYDIVKQYVEQSRESF